MTSVAPPFLLDATEQLEALNLKDPSADADFRSFEQNAETLRVEEPAPAKDRFVSPRDFELLKVIGMGAFGKVLQVRNKSSRQILAMKVISKRRLQRKEGYIENIQAERDILTRVNHPFVVKMHCSFQTPDKLFIIMDFLAGSELFLRLGREGIFLEATAAFYLAEIILALDHLHNLGIIHRDLKPENILLGSDGHVCLTDFGLAKLTDATGFSAEDDETRAMTICGTQEYMAPEMLSRQGYGRAADYWSLGCIAYEMLSGQPPFIRRRNESNKDLFRKIMTERVKMPDLASAAACKLLKGLLNRNVEKRLGCSKSTMFEVGGVTALKKAPFFDKIRFDKLEKKKLDPPVVLAVENDEDLQHFHTDFTNMELPRSVVMMSSNNFRPGHVESDLFRGFSFIQEDFVLPDRGLSEVEHYWNNIAGDANSDSEAASSKFDPTEAEPPAEPVKKKRPPRKRKKKKAGDHSTVSTPAASAAPTPIQSTAVTPATSRAVSPALSSKTASPIPFEKPISLSTLVTAVERTKREKTTQPLEEAPSTPTAAARAAPALRPQAAAWVPKARPSVPKLLNRQPEWKQARPNPPKAGSSQSPWQEAPITAAPQAAHSRGPTPSTASRRSGVSNVSFPLQGGLQRTRTEPASPSSDWRKHRMSPRASPRNVVRPVASQQNTWPSLDPRLSSPTAKKAPTLQGAWAARSKP